MILLLAALLLLSANRADCSFEISLDPLYLRLCPENTHEFSLNQIATTQSGVDTSSEVLIKEYNVEGEWSPGVRLGMLYPLSSCPEWDLEGSLTLYKGNADLKTHFSKTSPSITFQLIQDSVFPMDNFGGFQSFIDNGEYKTRQQFYLTSLDFGLGRAFSFGSCAILKPYLGLKFWGTKQNRSVHLNFSSGPDSQQPPVILSADNHFHSRSKYLAMGGKLGLLGSLDLGRNFSLFGNGGLSFVYGKAKLKTKINESLSYVNVDRIVFPIKEKQRTSSYQSRLIAESLLGVAWDFSWECWNVDLKIAWEYQMLFKQIQLIDGAAANLAVQGVSGSIGVEF